MHTEYEHTTAVTAYIGLGSNLANPVNQVKTAIDNIVKLPHAQKLAVSKFYSSPPLGGLEQPHYVNAVMAISTKLPPTALLHELQQIENQQGRVRDAERWSARTLDLDILLYDNHEIDLPHLIVPHYGLANRAFVLYPLAELAPDLHIPRFGHIMDLIMDCPLNGLVQLEL